MIISRTPFRVSFAGGGTDLPAFYRNEYGAVLSATIEHFMYVTVHRRFEPTIRVAYTKTEIVDHVDQIDHDLVRETLRLTGLEGPLEITTIGDVPAGTGLGSSSTLTIGLLRAFLTYRGMTVSPHELGRQACRIEIDVLDKPIGRQDQYAAAFGGLNYLRFNADDSVDIEPIPCRTETLEELQRHMLLLYTNQSREAGDILKHQSAGTAQRMPILRQMRDLAAEMRTAITGEGDLDRFAALLDEGWQLKRSLGFGITNSGIDAQYAVAKKAGAQGGKLLGAGGGGFLLLMGPPDRHDAIREAMGFPRELRFSFDHEGSKILFNSR